MMNTTERNAVMDALYVWGMGLLLMLCWPGVALGGQNYYQQQQQQAQTQKEPSYKIPNRFGMAVSYGNTIGLRDNFGFATVTGIGLFDYSSVWGHAAPRALRFKVELTAGSRTTGTQDGYFLCSANVLALYYLDFLTNSVVRPYIEGGIGGIYTDFKVYHQGSYINFNPVAGIGVEWFPNDYGPTVFSAIRAGHYSNAGLASPNTGVNSLSMQLGFLY
jgi:lipid A 3-O-deacylase